MRPRGIADQPDPVGIEAVLGEGDVGADGHVVVLRPGTRRNQQARGQCGGQKSYVHGVLPETRCHSGARAKLANPESSGKFSAWVWIPGSRCARPGMTAV